MAGERLILLCCLGACLFLMTIGSPSPVAGADETISPRELDVWGRFAIGSWKQTRIVSETIDDAGKSTSTTSTDVRTTITKVDAHHVTLKIAVTVEAGGKRYDAEPQIVQHGYFGEGPNQVVHLRELDKADVSIGGKAFSCRQQESTMDVTGQRTATKLFIFAGQAPYLLRHETVISDTTNPSAGHEETGEVLMVDMPYRVHSDMKSVAFERTVQKNGKGSTVSIDVTCVDVPGAIVLRALKELDSQGHVTRRSTIDLVDYNAVEEDQTADVPRPRLFHRRRARERASGGRTAP